MSIDRAFILFFAILVFVITLHSIFKDLTKEYKKFVIKIVAVILVIIALSAFTVFAINRNEQPKEVVETEESVMTSSGNGIGISEDSFNELTDDEEEELITNSDLIKDTVAKEINLLKNGDKATVEKYFGKSDVYTNEFISSVTSRVVVNFIDETVYSDNVHLHLCCVQYDEVEKAMKELEKEVDDETEISSNIAQRILDGEFNKCYNVRVQVDVNGMIPTEEFKSKITGGAYESVEIQEVDCEVQQEKGEKEYD